MSPTNESMLNRALNELEAILSNAAEMSIGEIRHAVGIAAQEIRNVLGELERTEKPKS